MSIWTQVFALVLAMTSCKSTQSQLSAVYSPDASVLYYLVSNTANQEVICRGLCAANKAIRVENCNQAPVGVFAAPLKTSHPDIYILVKRPEMFRPEKNSDMKPLNDLFRASIRYNAEDLGKDGVSDSSEDLGKEGVYNSEDLGKEGLPNDSGKSGKNLSDACLVGANKKVLGFVQVPFTDAEIQKESK